MELWEAQLGMDRDHVKEWYCKGAELDDYYFGAENDPAEWRLHCESLKFYGDRDGAIDYLDSVLFGDTELMEALGVETGEELFNRLCDKSWVDTSDLFEIYSCDGDMITTYFVRTVM